MRHLVPLGTRVIGTGALYLLLALAPSAAAVPALPDGYQPPTQTQPAPPRASAPEPVIDVPSSGIGWGTAALVALAVLVVAALVVRARRRWPVTVR